MKKITALILCTLMVFSLCACGSSHSAKTQSSMTTSEMYIEPAAPMMAAAGYYEESAADNYSFEDTGFSMSEGSDTALPEINPEKIIYSASATVETTEFDKCLENLAQLVSDYGGWVESSSISNRNYYNISRGNNSTRSANYTLRIPSEKFSKLMGSLTVLGNVPYTYTYSENVTAQYYDVQARITAYEAQEKRLIEMMELAESVEDVIIIEDRLAEIRYRLDSLQSSIKNWDRQVAYSTLSLDVQEVREYTPEKKVTLTYGQELWFAFTDALENAGQFFKDLLVFLVSALPTIVILVVLYFILRPLFRKLRAKRKVAKLNAPEKKAGRKLFSRKNDAEDTDKQ